MQEGLAVALAEFIHVGGALVVIIAVISVFTGIMREYIPQQKLQQKLAKNEKYGSFIGAALGILTPFCSASVVPVTMGMAEMGISMGTIFGFLISAPLCNFVVTGMILAVFGLRVALIYFLISFCSAVIAGFLMARSPWRNEIKRGAELVAASKSVPVCGEKPKAESSSCAETSCSETAPQAQSSCTVEAPVSCCGSTPEPIVAASTGCCGSAPEQVATASTSCCDSAPKPTSSCGALASCSGEDTSHAEKLKHALNFAWALFKRIIPYVLIGSVISAISAAYLPAEMVEKYAGGDTWYSIPVAAIIGVPLYLRIEMAIPLLKVLIVKGMGMGAAMALVIGGTGASLPEIAIISSILKPKAVIAFVFTIITTAIIGGVIFQVIL